MLLMTTYNGFILKTLIEIFFHVFKNDICLEFTETKIISEHITSTYNRMIKFTLTTDMLEEYHIDQPFLIGINLRQLTNVLKSIKKKDIVSLMINDTKHLVIKIQTSDNRRNIEYTIPFFNIQQIKIEPISGYGPFISLSIQEFSKLLNSKSYPKEKFNRYTFLKNFNLI